MKVFLDTSTIFKKYVAETGRDELLKCLESVSAIIVSPVCFMEIHSAVKRRVYDKILSVRDADFVLSEVKKDFQFYKVILWNEILEAAGIKLITKYNLRSLDAIVLSAGKLSASDLFITSDKLLYKVAQKELKETKLII